MESLLGKDKKIKITEVGPRDGLQNESLQIPTQNKILWIEKLLASGIQHLEVTSFVKKEAIPQLADAEDLSKAILPRYKGFFLSALTPNLIGYEKAVQSGYKEVAVFTAASESFTQKNIRASIKESLQKFKSITDRASLDGIKVRGYISTVAACPYEGWIDPKKVLDVAFELQAQGVYEISLGETIGKASPDHIAKLLDLLIKHFPSSFFAGHFHDTYGMAVANVVESLKYGLRSFDSSAGGLGGCPYAKGASGNLATEDLVYLLHTMNYKTGIDLDLLVQASQFMETTLNRKFVSKVYQAINQK